VNARASDGPDVSSATVPRRVFAAAMALSLAACSGSQPAGGDASIATGGACGVATDAGAPPDGQTFVRFDGGTGGSVTLSWTVNGQPGSSTTCLGNTATRLWAVNAIIAPIGGQGGYYNSQTERPPLDTRCAAGSMTFPTVRGGCYTVSAYLTELGTGNGPGGRLLSTAPAVMLQVGATDAAATVQFVVP
jgi:hypothetical protein